MTDVVVLPMEASELRKMIPKLQSGSILCIELVAEDQNNHFTLSFGVIGHRGVHRVHLPREGHRFQPRCHEFLNNDICNFLREQAGNQIKRLKVKGLHHIQQLSENILASMSGKGITALDLQDCAGNLSSDHRKEELELFFQPLLFLSLCDAAHQTAHQTAHQIQDTSHSELGRLISLSVNLERFHLYTQNHLTDAGFINVMNGLYSLQKVREIHLCRTHLGQYQMSALERFLEILKSLVASGTNVSFSNGSIALDGTRAKYFWTQLFRLPSLLLTLYNCTIPDSAAPLIRNLLAGAECQVARLGLYYTSEAMEATTTVMLEAFYNAVALNRSIKSLQTLTSLSGSQGGYKLRLAVSNAIQANTTLTKLGLYDDSPNREHARLFNALRQNQSLVDVEIGKFAGGPMDKESATAIGLYLESSPVLEKFVLSGLLMDLEGAALICKGARKSKSLKKLYVHQAPPECSELLVDMLAHNCNIVDAQFGNFKSDRIDYCLAWNQYGRKHLLAPSFPANLFPLIIARQRGKHAVSCIYTCLRECPQTVMTTPRRGNSRSNRERLREQRI